MFWPVIGSRFSQRKKTSIPSRQARKTGTEAPATMMNLSTPEPRHPWAVAMPRKKPITTMRKNAATISSRVTGR